MTIPEDKKDQAIYHTILSDMHRMQAMMLNLQTMTDLDTAEALREHFTREQNLTLARLNEWRQRRPELYREAGEDFQHQIKPRESPKAISVRRCPIHQATPHHLCITLRIGTG